MIKDESPYLAEWISFHLLQGFEHFFLYDNDSTDNTAEVLDAYRDVVTVRKISGTAQQFNAFNHSLEANENSTEWCAFIDCDEFLFSNNGAISALLPRYRRASALAVHWLLYGSSGLNEYEPTLVTRRFTKRQKGINQHVKSIVRPREALRAHTPHSFITTGPVYDENFNKLPNRAGEYCVSPGGTANIFRINHYCTKSKGEYYTRVKNRPRADTGVFRDFNDNFKCHDRNETEDLSALKFADAVEADIRNRL